ncbi:hypothetical protein XU18_1286 [Perkinsela sp. CCAP 1560/4]|nr:hypothetical protein XU18_1286 [Perkinsela sp. CCAP 1560/4]|eukprot:KNH00514.1 hypothetical protein XU18_1286 [Perkinsela sp. CCAP 1560/4]
MRSESKFLICFCVINSIFDLVISQCFTLLCSHAPAGVSAVLKQGKVWTSECVGMRQLVLVHRVNIYDNHLTADSTEDHLWWVGSAPRREGSQEPS